MRLPVYFISDIHLMLSPTRQGIERQQRLFRFFQQIVQTGGSLFIVGDLFNFYFEYPHLIPKMYFEFFSKLHQLKQQGIEIHYVLGNHDYWVLDFVTDTLTTKTYFNDTSFELAGKKFYVTHGDGIISWDKGYRLLKAIIRNPVFIWFYRWLHPTIGYNFAQWIANRGHQNTHPEAYNLRVQGELKTYALSHMMNGYDYVITGHYHQAVDLAVGGGRLVILGDWIHNNSYGYFDGQDFVLRQWETDE